MAARSGGLVNAQDARKPSDAKQKAEDTPQELPKEKPKASAARQDQPAKNSDSRSRFFVPHPPSPDPQDARGDDDSDGDDDVRPNVTPTKVVGYTQHWFKHKYGIIEKGPRNSRKLFIQRPKQYVCQDDTPRVDGKLKPDEKITRISSVANYYPRNFTGHYLDLLNPEKWGRSPLSRIQVGGADNRLLWVDRKAVRKHWPGGEDTVPVTEDLKVGDHVVLRQGQIVLRADLAIARRAVRSEENYRLWKTGDRKALDRSPSPMPMTEEPGLNEGDAMRDSVED